MAVLPCGGGYLRSGIFVFWGKNSWNLPCMGKRIVLTENCAIWYSQVSMVILILE